MASPPPRPAVVTLADPRTGTVVGLAPGGRLRVQFRRGVGPGRWYVAAHPGHLLPLVRDAFELQFLAFEGEPADLRLERRHPTRGTVHEVCELRVEVEEAAGDSGGAGAGRFNGVAARRSA